MKTAQVLDGNCGVRTVPIPSEYMLPDSDSTEHNLLGLSHFLVAARCHNTPEDMPDSISYDDATQAPHVGSGQIWPVSKSGCILLRRAQFLDEGV
jgi:hypothetical protein